MKVNSVNGGREGDEEGSKKEENKDKINGPPIKSFNSIALNSINSQKKKKKNFFSTPKKKKKNQNHIMKREK